MESIYTNVFDVNGVVGQEVLVRSTYQYHIVNNSNKHQQYTGYEELLVNLVLDEYMWKRPLSFSLEPGEERMRGDDIGFMRFMCASMGAFSIKSIIHIMGHGGGYAKKEAVLTVTSR